SSSERNPLRPGSAAGQRSSTLTGGSSCASAAAAPAFIGSSRAGNRSFVRLRPPRSPLEVSGSPARAAAKRSLLLLLFGVRALLRRRLLHGALSGGFLGRRLRSRLLGLSRRFFRLRRADHSRGGLLCSGVLACE